MTAYLEELFAHQAWADAEHWRAFEAFPPALEDTTIRERLLHIHIVQHAFLWATSPERSEFDFKKLTDFARMADLKKYAQQGLAEFDKLLKAAFPDRLEEVVEMPWFTPPVKISVRQAFTQAAMHRHYHRGQNATRLPELAADRLHYLAAGWTTCGPVEVIGLGPHGRRKRGGSSTW